jgi:hypothetical protein
MTTSRKWLLRVIALVTLVYGVAGLITSSHVNSNLPASAQTLSPSGMEALLETVRRLASKDVPWMSGYLIFLAIVMLIYSRRKDLGRE